MLFGDIHGFSKLTDAQLPTFTETIMGTLGKVARRHEQHIAFTNTWARRHFRRLPQRRPRRRLRARHAGRDERDRPRGGRGCPRRSNCASVAIWDRSMNLDDPITERPNYYGAHVSRAARIEPITPEGCVARHRDFLSHSGAAQRRSVLL